MLHCDIDRRESGRLTAIDDPAQPGIAPGQSGRRLRVFLVEDLPAVREVVIESLAEIAGLDVAGFAATEAGALAWLSIHDCDVVIVDLELKQGNGIGVLKGLADSAPRHSPLKIVYSNHVNAGIRSLAKQFGAQHFFDKTLDTPRLFALLRRLAGASA
jgi:DNA-binding NarL/FixJ family response regulator